MFNFYSYGKNFRKDIFRFLVSFLILLIIVAISIEIVYDELIQTDSPHSSSHYSNKISWPFKEWN